jgi:hypothetical protein
MSTTPIVDRIRIIPKAKDFLDRNVGRSGEVYFNAATDSLRVYTGKDRSGFEIARADLSNIPNDIFAAKVADFTFSGDYADLDNAPDLTLYATEDYVDTAISNIPEIDITGLATEDYVDQAVANLVGSAPETLDTLNELAAALGDDANFATTVTTALSEKAPINNPTFTGTVSGVTASMVGLGNVTDESKATMFTSPTFTGTTTLQQTVEVLNTLVSATGTVTHDFSTGAVWQHSSISANFTANFTNVPTTNNRTISVALILVQGATPYIPNVVQIAGTPVTISWQDNAVPTGNANKRDLVSFTFVRSGNAWSVLGSLSTYG